MMGCEGCGMLNLISVCHQSQRDHGEGGEFRLSWHDSIIDARTSIRSGRGAISDPSLEQWPCEERNALEMCRSGTVILWLTWRREYTIYTRWISSSRYKEYFLIALKWWWCCLLFFKFWSEDELNIRQWCDGELIFLRVSSKNSLSRNLILLELTKQDYETGKLRSKVYFHVLEGYPANLVPSANGFTKLINLSQKR